MPNDKAHVIVVSYYFPPDQAIGALRPFRFYKYLKRLGYTCEVITASEQPEGAPADVTHIPDPTAAFWETGQKGPFSREAHFERVVRKFLVPGQVGIVWSQHASRAVRAAIRRKRGRKTVLISSYPPLGAHLVGLQSSLTSRIPWIADFRDPMSMAPDLPAPSWRKRFTSRNLEKLLFRRADAVIANVEAAAQAWASIYPWARHKLHLIWNGFDPDEKLRALPVSPTAEKVILHAGNLYAGRNANAVVESLARLRSRCPEHVAGVRLLLVGFIAPEAAGIDKEIYARAVAEGWLEMRGLAPRDEAWRMTAQANGLLLLQPQSDIQVPGKLFEYLCVGRPILALAPTASPIEWILGRSGVPYVCIHPDDPAEIADAKLIDYLGLPDIPAPANNWFTERFDAFNQTRQLAAIIDGLSDRVSRHPSAPHKPGDWSAETRPE
jgi:glycosyltransferase involved in cell wall biosynthesis